MLQTFCGREKYKRTLSVLSAQETGSLLFNLSKYNIHGLFGKTGIIIYQV